LLEPILIILRVAVSAIGSALSHMSS
jgi:hypothetical protein